jgi:hypothetical protein
MVSYDVSSPPRESSGYCLDFKYKCNGYCSWYLFKVLCRGRSRSRYIFTDSDSTQNSFLLRLYSPVPIILSCLYNFYPHVPSCTPMHPHAPSLHSPYNFYPHVPPRTPTHPRYTAHTIASIPPQFYPTSPFIHPLTHHPSSTTLPR